MASLIMTLKWSSSYKISKFYAKTSKRWCPVKIARVEMASVKWHR